MFYKTVISDDHGYHLTLYISVPNYGVVQFIVNDHICVPIVLFSVYT